MDANRAQQILQTSEKIDVELNGVSVWIDSVDTEKQTARVHEQHNPADMKVVSVDQLKEVR